LLALLLDAIVTLLSHWYLSRRGLV
jgi:hypothetical protein